MFKIRVFEGNDLGGENERRRANLSLYSLFRVIIDRYNNHRIVERFVSRFVAFDRHFVNEETIVAIVIPIIIFFFPVLY